MTVELCQNMCARKGYVFAGVQFFDECFCGNNLPPVKKPESECNAPCKGDISQMCGGRLRNSVYETGVIHICISRIKSLFEIQSLGFGLFASGRVRGIPTKKWIKVSISQFETRVITNSIKH